MSALLELGLEVPAPGSRTRLRTLHRQVRAAIVEGRLKPGTRLPSTRLLAGTLGVSRKTTIALYDRLIAEGFLTVRARAGTFVSATVAAPQAAPRSKRSRVHPVLARRAARAAHSWRSPGEEPPKFDFRLGVPDSDAFPFDAWRRLTNQATRSLGREPATYGDAQGHPRLREAISRHIALARAVACTADDVLVTNGAQQALDLIARVLVERGTTVAVEDPGYPALRGAFARSGAKLHAVPVDSEGIRPDRIPSSARIICVTPSHQFPTGVAMSLRRRQAVLELARSLGALVVEDDYDGEFRHGGRPIDALQTLDRTDAVVYVGSFSKCLMPALRLGFAVVPSWLRPGLVAARQAVDWHSPELSQRTLAAFIGQGELASHIRRMRRIYTDRRDRLLVALRRNCADWLTPIPQEAGLHLAAQLAPGMRGSRIVERARERGLAIECLSRFALRRTRRDGLVFGFGNCPADEIDAAIEELARLRA